MSGIRRLIVGDITQGKLRGKALADELARQLTSEDKADATIKRKVAMTYGKNAKKK